MTPILHITHKARYLKAHADHFSVTYPMAFKDHGLPGVVIPDTRRSNGLTTFIVNYLTWKQHRATRINVSGRLIEQPEKQASGIILGTKKYMHSRTRKGSADISSTIKGRSIMWEVKTGRDRPSQAQLAEQEREQRAGGYYFFVHDVAEFFYLYDSLFVTSSNNATLL